MDFANSGGGNVFPGRWIEVGWCSPNGGNVRQDRPWPMVPILNGRPGSDRRDSSVDSYDSDAWWRAAGGDDGWRDCNTSVRARRKPCGSYCSLCDGDNCHMVPMARTSD